MKLIACAYRRDPVMASTCQVHRADGSRRVQATALQRQHPVSVVVDSRVAYTLVGTPEHVPELVMGRLFSDGVIDGIDDVAALHVCQRGDVVKVELARPAKLDAAVPVRVSTCNAAREAHVARLDDAALPVLPMRPFEPSWVFDLAAEFARDTPMHRRTRGAHSCFLARGSRVLFCCEDLGRHNAFDKAVGWALLNGVSLDRCLAVTSGRVPTDMAAKAIRARIPMLLSASVPTAEALDLSQRKGLTLIGRIKAEEVTVFCDPTGSMERAGAVSSAASCCA